MTQRAPRALLVQLGQAPDPVRAAHGCYPSWFERAWGGPIETVDGRLGAPLPHPREYDAVLVSGSPSSVTRPEPWLDEAVTLVRRCLEADTPLLGVCFGHQLIAHACGARVVKNPRGWEIGTLDIHLHEEGRRDPLFHGLPATIRVNLTHEDMVCHETLPRERIRILAANPKTEVQALAVGDKIRGIQFHPEVTGAVCHAYLQARRHLLAGQDVDELLRAAADCPDGTQVISNFRHFFVEGAAGPQMV